MAYYDVLVYHDLSSDEVPALGQEWGVFGDDMRVVAVGPGVHEGKNATVVLAVGARPMPDVQALLDTLKPE